MTSAAGKPLISIITSTYQAASALGATIESIRKQEFRDFEWIVVDGASSDATLQILADNSDIVSHLISEPDRGIYDAWNKGVRAARGHWLQFLGAGDALASASTLAQMAPHLQTAFPERELVYGDIQLVSERGREPVEFISRPWPTIKHRWEFFRPKLPMHPEVFHHRSMFLDAEPFDLRYRYCGDTLLMLRSVLKKDPLHVPVLIDLMPIGGVSTRPANLLRIVREIQSINQDLGLRPPLLHRGIEYLKLSAKLVIGLLPQSTIPKIMDSFRLLMGKPKKWRVE